MQPANLKEKIRAVRDACKNGTCGHTYSHECCPHHGADMWCSECVGQGQPRTIVLDDGEEYRGTVLGDVEMFDEVMASRIKKA